MQCVLTRLYFGGFRRKEFFNIPRLVTSRIEGYGGTSPDLNLIFSELSFVNPRIELQVEVCMKHLGFWLVVLVPGLLHAQHARRQLPSGGRLEEGL